jgi:hypothetical protein
VGTDIKKSTSQIELGNIDGRQSEDLELDAELPVETSRRRHGERLSALC